MEGKLENGWTSIGEERREVNTQGKGRGKITLRMFENPIKIHDVLCIPKITYSTYIVSLYTHTDTHSCVCVCVHVCLCVYSMKLCILDW